MKIRPLADNNKEYSKSELRHFLWDGYYESFFESCSAYDDFDSVAWRYVESGQIKQTEGMQSVSGNEINKFLTVSGLVTKSVKTAICSEPDNKQELPVISTPMDFPNKCDKRADLYNQLSAVGIGFYDVGRVPKCYLTLKGACLWLGYSSGLGVDSEDIVEAAVRYAKVLRKIISKGGIKQIDRLMLVDACLTENNNDALLLCSDFEIFVKQELNDLELIDKHLFRALVEMREGMDCKINDELDFVIQWKDDFDSALKGEGGENRAELSMYKEEDNMPIENPAGNHDMQERYFIDEIQRRKIPDIKNMPEGEAASIQRFFVNRGLMSESVARATWGRLVSKGVAGSVKKTISKSMKNK